MFTTQMLKIVIVIVVTVLISILIRKLINKFIKNNIHLIKGKETNYRFLKNASTGIIFLIGIIVVFHLIPEMKTLGTTLFAGAGIFAAVLAFASQAAFSNIIGGLFIVIFKPFRVGDIIEVQSNFGSVEDITLRHTVIRNMENKRVIIPNTIISNETITNRTIIDEKFRRQIDFQIGYDSNIDLAIKIIRDVTVAHPKTIDNRTPEDFEENKDIVDIKVVQWADSGVILRLFVWGETSGDSWELMCDLLYLVKKEFEKQGIDIPYPHSVVINRI